EGPCFEGWTTLSALAMATSRARIGTLVNGNTYRNPCVTAKMAATLDHVSGGRLNLGIGAGWFQLEHEQFGIDFKTIPGRLGAVEDPCEFTRARLRTRKRPGHANPHRGRAGGGPRTPAQPPPPPIMIGGQGEKVLLRIVAQYADMWNMSASAAVMAGKIDVIR